MYASICSDDYLESRLRTRCGWKMTNYRFRGPGVHPQRVSADSDGERENGGQDFDEQGIHGEPPPKNGLERRRFLLDARVRKSFPEVVADSELLLIVFRNFSLLDVNVTALCHACF